MIVFSLLSNASNDFMPPFFTSRISCGSLYGEIYEGKVNITCPRSRLRVWSRELRSTVPFPVSLLILHIKAEFVDYLRDPTLRYRASPEFIMSRDCVNDGGHYQESASKGPVVIKVTQQRDIPIQVPP